MSILKNNKIIIIEPSPVIQQGMKALLEEHSEFNVTNIYPDYQSFQDHNNNPVFDIILINPATINFHEQFSIRNLFQDYSNTILIALFYGYVNAETLDSFDGTVSIYDDAAELTKKLKDISKSFHSQQNSNREDNILSEREKEILASVAKGLTNKEIAEKHHISVHTVVSHRKNITRKTGIKTVSGLTIYAIFNNLIPQNDLE